MTIKDTEFADLPTPNGPMRTYLFRPAAEGKYPGILLYSEIFQVTGPIRRTAALLAGHGFVVAVPEIYHEFLPAGTVLAYDQAGADKGNELKTAKELASYDADARAALDFLSTPGFMLARKLKCPPMQMPITPSLPVQAGCVRRKSSAARASAS